MELIFNSWSSRLNCSKLKTWIKRSLFYSKLIKASAFWCFRVLTTVDITISVKGPCCITLSSLVCYVNYQRLIRCTKKRSNRKWLMLFEIQHHNTVPKKEKRATTNCKNTGPKREISLDLWNMMLSFGPLLLFCGDNNIFLFLTACIKTA